MTLEASITRATKDALDAASDSLIRVEAPDTWPVDGAIRELAGQVSGRFLVGLFRPFERKAESLDFGSATWSVDPYEITAWRNEKSPEEPLVVLGRASGEKTAGFADLAVVVKQDEVVDAWKDLVHSNWSPLPEKDELKNLIDALFERIRNRSLGAESLDDYLTFIRGSDLETLDPVYEGMWRLRLIPDRQAIDRQSVTARLQLNTEIVRGLEAIDEEGWRKKIDAALAPAHPLRETAVRLIEFIETGEFRRFEGIWLEDVLKILRKRTRRTPPNGDPIERWGVTELLNFAYVDAEKCNACLGELAEKWDLANPDLYHVSTELELDGEAVEVHLDLKPRVTPADTNEEEHSNRFLHIWTAEAKSEDALIGDSPLSEPKSSVRQDSSTKFRTVGHLTYALEASQDNGLQDAFEEFVATRHKLREYEPWISGNGPELLIIHDQARSDVSKFLDAWSKFVGRMIESQGTEVTQAIQMLDAFWGPSLTSPDWCILGALHPYNLEPLLATASLVETELSGDSPGENLGDRYEWLLERCHPAYPNIYSDDRTFYFASSGEELIYVSGSSTQLPKAKTGNGLETIIRSLAGFSPNLKNGMSICIVDAPPGPAITAQLKRLRRQMPLSASLAVTRSDADALDDEDLEVKFLGRFETLTEVETHARVRSNVALAFLPYPSGTSAATQGWTATKGTFLTPHLKIQVNPLLEGNAAVSADVLVQPRDHNSVVQSIHGLYKKRTGSLAKHFQFQPVLSENDELALRNLSNHCDWLIVAVPGPMGLAAPARINSQLHYVGRATVGPYALYVYACDELFATRKYIEHKLRNSPAHVDVSTLTNRLTKLAKDSAAAILAMGRSDAQVREHQAALVALKIAKGRVSSDSLNLVVSVDDVAWSQLWIGSGTRCDYLVVSLWESANGSLRCSLIGVESKSDDTSNLIEPSSSQSSFKKGIEQVTRTIDALANVVTPREASNLDQDVRFSTFVEHLMASVLSGSTSFDVNELKRQAALLNRFAARELTTDAVDYQGIVVLTQAGTNAESKSIRHQVSGTLHEVTLVRCTARDLDALFSQAMAVTTESKPISDSGPVEGRARHQDTPADRVPKPREESVDTPTNHDEGTSTKARESTSNEDTSSVPDKPKKEGGAPDAESIAPEKTGGYVLDADSEKLAHELLMVCQRHAIPLDQLTPLRILVGPSLFAVSVKLKVGAQINAIERRLDDIMRDLGLGDRANEVSVENDSEPSAVRFLIPRKNREFPSLPSDERDLIHQNSYLPLALGQTLDGQDFISTIESWPHMLVAGSSGSGKTTLLRSLLLQLARFPDSSLDLIVVDGKGDADYLHVLREGLFHRNFSSPLLGHEPALDVLNWAIEEMDSRRDQLHEYARSRQVTKPLKWPDIYKDEIASGQEPTVRPLIILIDEFADIMLAGKKSADAFLNQVQRIAQVGRSRLIHLILATQRPDRHTIKGAIKSNLDARIAMRLPSSADSMTILGSGGAEKLLKWGDFWFQHGGSSTRLQGYDC
mgnify:CR=1 FL=1